MNKNFLFVLFFILLLIYPGYSLFHLDEVNSEFAGLDEYQRSLTNYQISIWVSWVFLICIAIYYKWTRGKNLFFNLTYLYLLLANIFFGYYFHKLVVNYDFKITFQDDYTLSVIKGLQNFAVGAILTVLLQAGVWWFTRRWHRR